MSYNTLWQSIYGSPWKADISIYKLIFGVFSNMAIYGGLLFLPAGTLDWWRAWAFLGVVFMGAVAGIMSLARTNRAVIEERFQPPNQKGQPLVDKIIVVVFIASYCGLIAFIPLDVFRLHLLA